MTNLVNNELQLVESKDVREQYVERVDVLEKVKELILLGDDTHVTIKMASSYYEVDAKTIEGLIFDHSDELIPDGMKTLKGDELKVFKGLLLEVGNLTNDIKFAPSLTLIPRKALLRIGMLLRDSEVAKKVRTYLLKVEEKTSTNVKIESLVETMYADNLIQSNNIVLLLEKLDLLMARHEQLESNDKKLTEENKILRLETYDMKIEIKNMMEMVKEVNEKFQLPNNPSGEFEIYKVKFNIHQGHFHKKYMELYNALENWFGYEFIEANSKNIKEYVITVIGMPKVKEFINGVISKRIIKSDMGNWIDTFGYNHNDIEFNRTIKQFNCSCAYCGITEDELYAKYKDDNEKRNYIKLQAEHLIKRSSTNSTNMIYNILPICGVCNESKFAEKFTEWYPKQKFHTKERMAKIKEHYTNYHVDMI